MAAAPRAAQGPCVSYRACWSAGPARGAPARALRAAARSTAGGARPRCGTSCGSGGDGSSDVWLRAGGRNPVREQKALRGGWLLVVILWVTQEREHTSAKDRKPRPCARSCPTQVTPHHALLLKPNPHTLLPPSKHTKGRPPSTHGAACSSALFRLTSHDAPAYPQTSPSLVLALPVPLSVAQAAQFASPPSQGQSQGRLTLTC